ncbi:hypothetical protein SDC9_74595 [bioreactor metagenome]|uniref:Uncharacterized protein n=1 Tax=bioreactor metagenome TaxID=1076179 RepID=A0A644YJ92_9ZZZZ
MPAVDAGFLHRGLRRAVRVKELGVRAVLDDRLQGRPERIAQRGVLLGHGDAEWRGGHLVTDGLVLAGRLLGAVDGDRVVLQTGDGAVLLDLQHRLRLVVEGQHVDLALARLLAGGVEVVGDVVVLHRAALQGDGLPAEVVDGLQAVRVAGLDDHHRAGQIVVDEVHLLLAFGGVAHRRDGGVEPLRVDLGDQPVEGGVVVDHRDAELGAEQRPEVLVEADDRLAVGVEVLHRGVRSVRPDLDRALVLHRLGQLRVQRGRRVHPTARRGTARGGRAGGAATTAGGQATGENDRRQRGEYTGQLLHRSGPFLTGPTGPGTGRTLPLPHHRCVTGMTADTLCAGARSGPSEHRGQIRALWTDQSTLDRKACVRASRGLPSTSAGTPSSTMTPPSMNAR